MELLERAAVLDALAEALTAARGSVVLVTGEAGIGKSALVRHFARRHATEARFLVGACDPLLTPRALGPLHDLGRQTGGRLAALLAAGGSREQLFTALLDELDGGGHQRVVVVEDAHWADEATLDLLVFLGRRIATTSALLVVTYRDDELAADHPLRTVVGRLPAESVRRLPLDGLSSAAVAELAHRAGRPATGLRALTGGNPLLVTEVLATADAGVPMTIRDLVLARVGGLPEEVREVLRLVAVIPTSAELWLLERLATVPASGVETAGLLVVRDDAVAYRHELLRRAVEGSLSVLHRRELNRRILAALSGGPVDVARLMHHAREAGDDGAVLRYGPEAARQAAAVAAHREAVGHYRAVLTHSERLGAPVPAEVLEGYSVECYLSGLSAEAVTARRNALALREAAGDREKVGDGLRWLSRLHWWDGNRTAAEETAAQAIAVLRELPPGPRLAMAYSNQAQLDMLAYRLSAAARWAAPAIELARQFGDQEILTHALTNIGTARLQGGDAGGRAALDEAFQVAVASGLDDHAARALCNLATTASELRDYRHAGADLDRALAFTRPRELAGYTQHLLGHRARLRLDRGDWPGAERDAREALAELVHGGARVVDALVPLGLLQARRGDPAADATLAEAADLAFATGDLQWIAPAVAARAEHRWLHGGADPALEETFALAVEAGQPWFAGELGYWLLLAGTPVPADLVAAEPYRLLFGGDWRGAAAAWEALGCPYHRALALAHSTDDAAVLEALAGLDALGARQTAERLRRDLRTRGVRVPRGPTRSTSVNPAGLTARQVEVLVLVADGLRDAEIATRLSLSTKTVGHHVSAVLAKLAVASRHEAAARAAELGIAPAKDGEPADGSWGRVPDSSRAESP
ncbi:Predicted ATPase [Asanoa hainanensis]|uniref:Predicted ATPase n=1 Tax=Asanoa hainanensis TaxID=560556 RepID=A0A239FU03_9ACTN|nr:AAA family ATPase [Asanoa hainanensis]SNS60371.1 Predicted ATPase [Asanoa hainanensis]